MPKKKKPPGRRRFNSPDDVRNVLRDLHRTYVDGFGNMQIRPAGTFCIKCKLRVFLVQNEEGEQFYVTSVVRGQPHGKRWCRH